MKTGDHDGFDYYGVVSYALRDKIGYTKEWHIKNIANHSNLKFSPTNFHEVLDQSKPDVLSFARHPAHDPVQVAERFHRGFTAHFTNIMKKIGYDYRPTVFQNNFYWNFFVAKPEIYERYVSEMLAPAMDVMEGMPELLTNAGYQKLPPAAAQKLNLKHYPFHTFLCERMFSYFAHINRLKCAHF